MMHPIRRVIPVTAALMGVALLAAGCGGVSPTTSTSGADAQRQGRRGTSSRTPTSTPRACANHGVANFPDPKVSHSSGGTQVAIRAVGPASSPQFNAAQQACRGILPAPSTADQAQQAADQRTSRAGPGVVRALPARPRHHPVPGSERPRRAVAPGGPGRRDRPAGAERPRRRARLRAGVERRGDARRGDAGDEREPAAGAKAARQAARERRSAREHRVREVGTVDPSPSPATCGRPTRLDGSRSGSTKGGRVRRLVLVAGLVGSFVLVAFTGWGEASAVAGTPPRRRSRS